MTRLSVDRCVNSGNTPKIFIYKGATRMPNEMKTYVATDQHGNAVHVSAYTESMARQKAEDALGWGNVSSVKRI